VKTGVQCFCNALKSLDSGFHRNDDSWAFSTFYDGFKYNVARNFYEKMVIDCSFMRGGGYIWAVVVSKIPKKSRAILTK